MCNQFYSKNELNVNAAYLLNKKDSWKFANYLTKILAFFESMEYLTHNTRFLIKLFNEI